MKMILNNWTVEINMGALNAITDAYCSCGGRGPQEDPCVACAILHRIVEYKAWRAREEQEHEQEE